MRFSDVSELHEQILVLQGDKFEDITVVASRTVLFFIRPFFHFILTWFADNLMAQNALLDIKWDFFASDAAYFGSNGLEWLRFGHIRVEINLPMQLNFFFKLIFADY